MLIITRPVSAGLSAVPDREKILEGRKENRRLRREKTFLETKKIDRRVGVGVQME